jgi:hypothetical protein
MGQEVNVEKLVLRIVNALVDDTNEVQIKVLPAETGIMFEVRVAPTDVGKIIGQHGRMARAIRELLFAIGVATKTRYWLRVIDTNDRSTGIELAKGRRDALELPH